MSSSRFFKPRLFAIGFASVALATSASPQGQSSQAGGSANSFNKTLDDVRADFVAGNHGAVMSTLVRDIDAPRNSGDWSMEAGTRLMHLATSFANRKDHANSRAAAAEAIAMLEDAEQRLVREGRPKTAARAQELIGTLNENILHNDDAALAAYQKALQHNPNAAGAQNANARLGRGEKG